VVKEAIADGAKRVIAGGGDGTINAVPSSTSATVPAWSTRSSAKERSVRRSRWACSRSGRPTTLRADDRA